MDREGFNRGARFMHEDDDEDENEDEDEDRSIRITREYSTHVCI